MEIKLEILSRGNLLDVTDLVEGELRVTTSRIATAGRLVCNLVKDKILDFHEGDQITLHVNNVPMFFGRVFRKRRNSDNIIEVTAYDQLIYLKKNKETLVYENLTASDLVRKFAKYYDMKLGYIEDTELRMSKPEEIQTVMDIIYTAINTTLMDTGNIFVLYDDFGKLTLRNTKDMRLNIKVGSEETLIDYTYSTDIDTHTYNMIKLVQDNEEVKKRQSYYDYDSENIDRWGRIQLHEQVNENLNPAQIERRVQQFMKLFNRVNKELTIEELNGDPRVRAGSSVYIKIDEIGEIDLEMFMVIDECTHSITNNEHTMRLRLYGRHIPE